MTKPMIRKLDDPKNHFGNLAEYIDTDKPVKVYKNLHTGTWSIKQGTVRLHTDYITLKNVRFRVSQAGRERVLRERKKNVHAMVEGYLCTPSEINAENLKCKPVRYNPYLFDSFVLPGAEPISTSRFVDMCTGDQMGEPVLAFI